MDLSLASIPIQGFLRQTPVLDRIGVYFDITTNFTKAKFRSFSYFAASLMRYANLIVEFNAQGNPASLRFANQQYDLLY